MKSNRHSSHRTELSDSKRHVLQSVTNQMLIGTENFSRCRSKLNRRRHWERTGNENNFSDLVRNIVNSGR